MSTLDWFLFVEGLVVAFLFKVFYVAMEQTCAELQREIADIKRRLAERGQ